jgi:DNA processing protein
MSVLKYWVWLSSLPGLGLQKAHRLLERFGAPENIFFADRQDLEPLDFLTPDIRGELSRRSLSHAERILEECDAGRQQIITLQDLTYPERLRNITLPPLLLYIKGRLPRVDEEAAIAIVGTREITPYGYRVAEEMGYGLTKGGALVVSGMAAGGDSAAHIGALKAGGTTVAVLGCGADVIFPPGNEGLYYDILTAGAVVSEYPPGTEPLAAHFPARNRIVAGMCCGLLIAEAGKRSGALISARFALEQGRDVFAVPHNIDTPAGLGGNEQIMRGEAQLVTCAGDILREYAPLYPHKIKAGAFRMAVERSEPPKKGKAEPPKPAAVRTIDLTAYTETQRAILSALIGASAAGLGADELVRLTKSDPAALLTELTTLEILGTVDRLPGDVYILGADANA